MTHTNKLKIRSHSRDRVGSAHDASKNKSPATNNRRKVLNKRIRFIKRVEQKTSG